MGNLSDIGVVGLAVMGENLALNISNKGYRVSVYNRTAAKVEKFINGRGKVENISGYQNLQDFVASLEPPRKVLLMLKAGGAVDDFIETLLPLLDKGDIIIDGGNSNYQKTKKRMDQLEAMGFLFIGTGVSGGEEGALNGPSLMPGGSPRGWSQIEPIFMDIAAKADDNSPCCTWIGDGGAGHFVKMVHNGIEYGDMQLICESYHLMKDLLGLSATEIHDVFRGWNEGELASYLVEITADILTYKDEDGEPLIHKILDSAGQKGTGKWSVSTALDYSTPLSLINEAVTARFISANKEQRMEAAAILSGPEKNNSLADEDVLRNIAYALYGARIIAYAQGFSLMSTVSQEFVWRLPLADIARIWRGGCIIRSALLEKIATAYQRNAKVPNLLLDPYFAEKIHSAMPGLRSLVTTAVAHGIPVPCHSAALSYFDSYRCAKLPANLLQAQRDYFGAHTYERVDKPRGEYFHTNWTGKGGETTSTTYSR